MKIQLTGLIDGLVEPYFTGVSTVGGGSEELHDGVALHQLLPLAKLRDCKVIEIVYVHDKRAASRAEVALAEAEMEL